MSGEAGAWPGACLHLTCHLFLTRRAAESKARRGGKTPVRRKERRASSEEEEETPRQRRGKGAAKTPAKTPSRKKKAVESSEEEDEEEDMEDERVEEAQVCYPSSVHPLVCLFNIYSVQVDSEDDDFVQPAAPVVRRGGRRR